MRVRRTLIYLATTFCASLLPAAAAAAQPNYPPAPPSLNVSAGAVTVGDSVLLRGSNYGPNEQVTIDVSYGGGGGTGGGAAMAPVTRQLPMQVVQTVRADGHGSFETNVRLTRVGTAVIEATGSSSGMSASVTVRAYAHGQALPTTGEDGVLSRVAVGALAVAVGALLVVGAALVRRRNRARTNA